MDRLLNLVAAIEENNDYQYNINLNTCEYGEWDFILTCKSYGSKDNPRMSYDFSDLYELLNDFREYEIQSYVNKSAPLGMDSDDVVCHSVEIRVRR